MKICIFGTAWFDNYYSRNAGIYEALSKTGHEIAMCAFAGLYRGRRMRRIIWLIETPVRWLLLLFRIHRIRGADILYLPYPAFIDIWPALLFRRIFGTRIYYDVFIGLYDSVVRDRQLATGSFTGNLIFAYERFILKRVDRCFIDTVFHKQMLVADYQLQPGRIFDIPNPIAEEIWSTPGKRTSGNRAIFWGTYIPLHGTETIIAAARILQDNNSPIEICMVGQGQELARIQGLAREQELDNIDFITDFLPMPELKAQADRSTCALGIFSTGEKADRVIPYKIAQALCASMPVITASTTAARDLAGDTGGLCLVPPGNARALAEAIIEVCSDEDTRNRLSETGRRIFEERLSRKAIHTMVSRAFE